MPCVFTYWRIIWRRNEIINGKDPFLSAIELMANTVFFSPLEDNE